MSLSTRTIIYNVDKDKIEEYIEGDNLPIGESFVIIKPKANPEDIKIAKETFSVIKQHSNHV